MTDKERRIREVAHQIWEDEGRPADQAERHWEMAQRIVEATGPEDSEPTLVPGADPKGAASTSGEEATTTNGTDRTVSTGPEPLVPRARSESRGQSRSPPSEHAVTITASSTLVNSAMMCLCHHSGRRCAASAAIISAPT